MSGPVALAAQMLAETLGEVAGLSVFTDPMTPVSGVTPAAVIGAPTLMWRTYQRGGQPSDATFPVHLVESLDENTMTRLWDLLPLVVEVLDGDSRITTTGQVTPTVWPSDRPNQEPAPAYLITAEVNLGSHA